MGLLNVTVAPFFVGVFLCIVYQMNKQKPKCVYEHVRKLGVSLGLRAFQSVPLHKPPS